MSQPPRLLWGHLTHRTCINSWVASKRRQCQFGKWADLWHKVLLAFSLLKTCLRTHQAKFSALSPVPPTNSLRNFTLSVVSCLRMESTEGREGGREGIWKGAGGRADMKPCRKETAGSISSFSCQHHSTMAFSTETEGISNPPSLSFHMQVNSFSLTHV